MRRPSRGGLPKGATVGIEFFTATITAAVVLAGAFHHFLDSGDARRTFPGEGRRIVAFRQVANRICAENTSNMDRALREADDRIQLIGYLQRAVGWDVHDLTTVTPPPSMIEDFLDEVAARRHLGVDLGRLQRAARTRNSKAEAQIQDDLRATQLRSTEVSGTLALPKCAPLMPALAREASIR